MDHLHFVLELMDELIYIVVDSLQYVLLLLLQDAPLPPSFVQAS
jgi:hypothetical protein